MLGVPEEIPGERVTGPGWNFHDDPDVMKKTIVEVRTLDVVDWLVERAPRERVRKMLRDLDAYVTVSPPRPRTEWREYGPTPPEKRVALMLPGGITVRPGQEAFARLSQTMGWGDLPNEGNCPRYVQRGWTRYG